MKKFLFIITGSVIIFSSCKRQLDINRDPSKPDLSQGSPSLVFPVAVMSSAGRIGGDLTILGGIWSEYYTQAYSSNQYKTIDAYNLQNTDYNGAYTELYSGAINDYQYVLDKSNASGDWNYFLMATVMKAYTVEVLADLYDKVPYSQASLGTTNLNPAFDDGYTIYTDLLKKIDEALGKDFAAKTNTPPGANDLIFGGDISKWKKFANTLKLKMYLRMVNAKPAEAEAGIKKLYSDGAAFLDVNAAVTGYTETPDKQNPFYAYNIQRLNVGTNLRASRTFTSWLAANGDPRSEAYFGVAAPTAMHQGDYTSTDPSYGTTAVFVQSATDPVEFISLAESYFMQAEARERYFGGVDAQTLYNDGVLAAFDAVGNDGSTFVAPGGKYAYPVAGTLEQKIEAIIVQKWASLPFGSHSLEAFFERNRTGYPKSSTVYSTDLNYIPGQLVYSKNGVTGGKFPKRLVFPDVERSRNTSTPAEVPLTTPVWWAK
ncbi:MULTISPECIES: SusD/RagB family nutrient-binding outer membrane lipoprotein [Niastella]|uniref:SusD/RagB family nutrient-binding outer membrane lipoprotein n=1 Tax=Niastella soli TaxID=2821487 RepID=A0ABS3YSP8_9BACT|nr:SusD/RagB family nutrient-binding outer membrane lipoprotein [Niastella soli]MBO9200942.1 SusD/RagB family nutrient-binding outer membrane lipoprotein [Niastella soli]